MQTVTLLRPYLVAPWRCTGQLFRIDTAVAHGNKTLRDRRCVIKARGAEVQAEPIHPPDQLGAIQARTDQQTLRPTRFPEPGMLHGRAKVGSSLASGIVRKVLASVNSRAMQSIWQFTSPNSCWGVFYGYGFIQDWGKVPDPPPLV